MNLIIIHKNPIGLLIGGHPLEKLPQKDPSQSPCLLFQIENGGNTSPEALSPREHRRTHSSYQQQRLHQTALQDTRALVEEEE